MKGEKPLRRFDDFLIDKVFQPMSNRWHALTGQDSVDQVQLLWRVSGLAWAACCGWSMAHGQSWQVDAFMAFLSISLSFVHSPAEERARWGTRNGLRNPYRLGNVNFWFRIAFVVVVVPASLVGTWNPYQTLLVIMVFKDYLQCCDPQGPGNSKIKEWLKRLVTSHRAVPAPQEGS